MLTYTRRIKRQTLSILFALVLVSCTLSSNQPVSKSSTSDSAELKKQEAWESAHRLDSMGNHREALLLRERTLSEYCPNSAECLQYKGLRCYIENKQDSANFYFAKTTRMCDMALRDSLSTRHHDSEALLQLKESTEGIRNVVEVIKSLK